MDYKKCDHPHGQDKGHVHNHEKIDGEMNKTKALLQYMIHHNEHHAEELAELLDQLPVDARKKLRMAIGTFEVANVELQSVLECLE